MSIYDILFSFFTYSFLGWVAEVAFAAIKERRFVNRGFLNGPFCPIYGTGVTLVVLLMEPCADNLFFLYVISAVLVTILEYITGAVMEKLFHHKWWDYSQMPLNIQGYVCVPFSLIWGAACVIIVKGIYPGLYRILSFLPKWFGIVLLVLLGLLLIVDLCVTVAGIRNWNQHLDKMEDIARELHRLSEQIGENIYQNVMEGIEREEIIKEKAEELKKRYREMLENQNRTGRRLLKAFPKLKSKNHEERLEELKKWFKTKRF